MSTKKFDVVVLGSCMIDLICYARRLPKVGETLHGTSFQIGDGGKGANQCVAAAKLGASTSLIARLGNDMFGEKYKKSLTSIGVNTEMVTLTEGETSGMAQISVSSTGDNTIIIVAGANNRLSVEDVDKSKDCMLNAKVVIFQFETPLETTVYALSVLKQSESLTIVNGAPALSDIDKKIFTLCDIFCVNESEAADITKILIDTVESAKQAIKILQELGCKCVILTLGAQGVAFNDIKTNEILHVPVEQVEAVDTTGAGDAFVGAFGFFTAKFPTMSMIERVKRSCIVATMSVLKKGTQQSYPSKEDLPKDLFYF